MKVLFAVHDEKVSLSIVKKYQKEYKEIISYKNVYYFNAILKEIQRDKSYDRIIIDEELEEFTSTSYEEKDKFVFNKLDSITDEASNTNGKDIPIILICTERRTKSDDVLVKLFGIGIYNAIIGNDRSTDEVCRLINSPRSKKDAKNYYKIDSKNVDYDPEDENDVSEEEMQHILSYFKKLGKNADKYDECFRKIASQYNEAQMKIIVAILPKNIKEVLQDVSEEYQKFANGTTNKKTKNTKNKKQPKEENTPTSEKLLNSKKDNNKKQIVVPSSIDKNLIKKLTLKKPSSLVENIDDDDDDDNDDNEIYDEVIKSVSSRRGRPAKKIEEDFNDLDDIIEVPDEKPKKKIGRPQLAHEFDKDEDENKDRQLDISELKDEFEDILPGIGDDDEPEENKKVSNFEDKYEPIDESLLRPEPIIDDILPGIYDEDETEDYDSDENEDISELYNKNRTINDDDDVVNEDLDVFNINNDDDSDNKSKQDNLKDENNSDDYDDVDEILRHQDSKTYYDIVKNKEDIPNRELQTYENNYSDYDYTNYNNLLSSERKVIAFVGTSKNGTSFIVNNVARMLAENGINTAILDATQNKNAYYIYNDNDDGLRNDAANSIENLIQGRPGGISVAKNLSVYVEVPGQDNSRMNEVGPILENLAQNHSATLVDCDFNTPLDYFANVQEIYLVQSMDVLTIQPLTAFLKDLKNRDILEQQKIRIILNKALRLKGITSKKIVGGMSRYNNPEMSMMTELFDRNAIVPIEIPFDLEVYERYLEGLADCNIAINRYPRDFQNLLNKLSNIIYPLLPARKKKNKSSNNYQSSNDEYASGFSNNVNNTLNDMRKKY